MIELIPAIERSVIGLADLQSRSMDQYVRPLANDPSELARRIAVDAIDLSASFIANVHGKDVGYVLVSRRGGFARIVNMGVLPELRRQNIGRSLVDAVMAGARRNGDVKMVLECFDDNEAALALYRAAGLHAWRRLVGWERNLPNVLTKDPTRGVVERPLRHAAWACAHNSEKDLPWQLAPESIANLAPPYRAFEHDHSSYCIVRMLDDGTMRVRAFVTRAEARRRGLASIVLAGAVKALGAKRVVVPPWCPEGVWDTFFLASGFTRTRSSQVEFRRSIESAAKS